MVKVAKSCHQVTQAQKSLHLSKFVQISYIFCPYLIHINEIPLKFIALVCVKSFFCIFCSLVKRRVKTDNCVSIFAVVVVVNTEIFISFIKLPFRNKQFNFNNLTFCFLGTFSWAPILVNWYEICSRYDPDIISKLGPPASKTAKTYFVEREDSTAISKLSI